ncbi:unnamed protein product [Chironomus riparius]|uniref:Uncharacterized protein n=1 Tax=Chironomus riparius TaxID=315576 RepID=A0A9N9RZ55_9DIPT|nr:unnamed protein product [Chironomus riparius]
MNPSIIRSADDILNTYQINCAPCTFFSECSLILKFDAYRNFKIQESEVIFKHIYAIRVHRSINERPKYYLYPENKNFKTYPSGWKLEPQYNLCSYTDLQPAELYSVVNFGVSHSKCVEVEFMIDVYVDSERRLVWIPCERSTKTSTHVNLRITIARKTYQIFVKEVNNENVFFDEACEPSTTISECSFILKYENYMNFKIQECETIFKHITAVRYHKDIHSHPQICLYPQNTELFSRPLGWKIDRINEDFDENVCELQSGELEGYIEFGETRPKAIAVQFKLNVFVDSYKKIVYIVPRKNHLRNQNFVIIDIFFNRGGAFTLELQNIDEHENENQIRRDIRLAYLQRVINN